MKAPGSILDFPAWVEFPYLYPGPHEDAELSKHLLTLVDKLRSAKAPLSRHYQRRPEVDSWGFGVADFTRHLDPADEMGVLVTFFRDLRCALSTPREWLGDGPHSANRVTTCRGYIEVGLYLIRHFGGEMDLTVRSSGSGAAEKIELRVNQACLQAVQDELKMPHEASEMEYEAQIYYVDFDRWIVLSSMGVLQIQDPEILSMCYERVGKWCTICVDTAAAAIRIAVPELSKIGTN